DAVEPEAFADPSSPGAAERPHGEGGEALGGQEHDAPALVALVGAGYQVGVTQGCFEVRWPGSSGLQALHGVDGGARTEHGPLPPDPVVVVDAVSDASQLASGLFARHGA